MRRRNQFIRAIEEDLEGILRHRDTLTVEQALSIPAVTACIEFISGTIAMLPVKLYRKTDKGPEEITDDVRVHLLNNRSDDTLTAYQQKKAFVADYLKYGAGYLYIDKTLNNVKSLRYVEAQNVGFLENNDPIFRSIKMQILGREYYPWDFVWMARNPQNGYLGKSVIEDGQELLKSVYNEIVMEGAAAKAGGARKGFFIYDKMQQGDKRMQNLKTAIKQFWSSDDAIGIVDGNPRYEQGANSFADMQIAELKRQNSAEICKMFSVAPGIIDGTATKDSYQSSVKTAILPIVHEMTAALNNTLLLESEKDELYWDMDLNELLKGSTLERYQAYKLAIDAKVMTPDEARAKEGMESKGMDFVTLGLSDVIYFPDTNEIYTPNTNTAVKVEKGGLQSQTMGN